MEIVKKKILFIVTQSEYGGAQRYIYEICRALSPEKYEVLVAAGQGDKELFRKLKTIGIQSRELKQMARTPWPWQIIKSLWEIYKLLKKERPNVLFLCSTTAGLLGSLASKIYKLKTKNYQLKTIYRIGGWAFRDPRAFWKNWLILAAEKLTSPLKDLIIVNSEVDWRIAVKNKIASPEKIIKIYNGIDVNSLEFLPKEEAREKLNVSRTVLDTSRTVLVGTVANFYKTKGLKYLIEAATRSDLQRRSDLRILIIGDGRERLKLENLIKKYGLEKKVILAGRIPDAYKYLKSFDVFVLPSLKEGLPWIILEAIAAEVPIVATNVGALPEILNEESLVEPKNAEALAKKISWMLEHLTKTKLKQEFTSRVMIEKTLEVLSK